MNAEYNRCLSQIVSTIDRINDQSQWINEGLSFSEWKYIKNGNKHKPSKQDLETARVYLSRVKEVHYHIESILNYVNQLSEDEGVPIRNEC